MGRRLSFLNLQQDLLSGPRNPAMHAKTPPLIYTSTEMVSVYSVQKIKCKSLANMPVAMNNATGIIHNNELIVGGGYTSSSGDNLLVHMYDSNFDIWSPLPPAPLKWSAVASLDNKLVLVGGKEPGIPTAGYTNKLSIFDKESKTWKFFSPSMQVARLSPVVLTYGGYLIVAGGSKGSLDYNAEIFDPEKRWWMIATPLPHKCFRHTSTTIDRVWYLLNQDSGHIYCADIPTFVKQSHDSDQHHLVDYVEDSPVEDPASLSSRQPVMKEMNEQNQTGVTILWRPIETQPPSKPFRITSIEGHLLALSHSKGVVTAHAYMAGSWEHVGKLPITATTASMAVDSTGQLYLFGGEGGGGQYSSKLTQVTLVSRDYKKPKLHVGLTTAPLIINQ